MKIKQGIITVAFRPEIPELPESPETRGISLKVLKVRKFLKRTEYDGN
jgi:hypothetical protein